MFFYIGSGSVYVDIFCELATEYLHHVREILSCLWYVEFVEYFSCEKGWLPDESVYFLTQV